MKKIAPLFGILTAAVVLAVRIYMFYKEGDDSNDDILTAEAKRGKSGFKIFR